MQRRLLLFLTPLLLIIGIVPMAAAQAQDSTTTIQLSVPQFMKQIITDQLIADFQTANPTIKVDVLANDDNSASAAAGVDAHLKSEQAYASTADVLFVDNSNLSVQATRAGYFLDMTPLTSSDTGLNSEDFIPGVWQSFQWDNGIWAMPVSTDVIILTYNPAEFDKIGLAYPNERWTIDDLDNAARKLAVVDASGAVTTAGLAVSNFNVQWLFRSLLGKGFYDASTTPNAPLLSDPTLQTLMTTWAQLVTDKMVSSQGGFAAADTVPMQIGGSRTLGRRPGNNQNQVTLSASLLPGGGAGLNAQGFAISSGTQYPEQAYALVKYLTSSPDVTNNFFGISPARQSLVGATTSNNNGGPGGGGGPNFGGPGGGLNNLSDANKAVVTQALSAGIPLSEVRFGDYVTAALSKMSSDGSDAQTALQTLEAQAVADLQSADTAKTDNPVVLATPVPEIVLQPGQVSLKFGLNSFVAPLPNQDKWNQLVADFTANDPQVKDIKLDVQARGGNEFAATDDCFYLPYNNVPGIDLSTVINLDPFIDSDSTFDKNDVIGNTLSLITRDNKIWAYPLALQPVALEYNADTFAKYNVPDPASGWTINGFTDALKSIKLDPADAAPFASREPGGTYLLMLIAAYGGIPIDYRTDPPTVDFTSQKNIDAIRQVLDLAKNGYLKYDKLASNTFFINADTQTPESIYDTVLNGFSFRGRRGGGPAAVNETTTTGTTTAYKLTTYPTGTDTSAVSYDITTAYVSATSQNPEGCYRWISYLSKHPEVLNAMPAFRSQLADVATVQSANAANYYTLLDNLIQQPSTLVFPSQTGGGFNSPANFLLQFWMNRAFDNYVLNNGTLETDLADAQTYSKAFQECVATIPPFDPATQDRRAFFTEYGKCAQKADPTISGLFGGGG